MISILEGGQSRSWNPDSRRGEGRPTLESQRRRDIWFFLGILAFIALLFFVWQQHRGMRLADEVARLEAQKESLAMRIVEMNVEVTRLSQPDRLLSDTELAGLDQGLGERRYFVPSPSPAEKTQRSGLDAVLAGVGFEVSSALADRP